MDSRKFFDLKKHNTRIKLLNVKTSILELSFKNISLFLKANFIIYLINITKYSHIDKFIIRGTVIFN